MKDSPTKAATKSPRKLPSVHFQKRLILRCSIEFALGPENRARNIAPAQTQLHSAYILGPRLPGSASILLAIPSRRPFAAQGEQDASATQARGSSAFLGDQLFTFLLIPRQRALDHRDRRVRRAYVFHFDALAFQLLVILEKALQHQQAMWWQIACLHVAAEFRVVGGHGDHFVVTRAGINHRHQSYGARLNQRQRLYRLLA